MLARVRTVKFKLFGFIEIDNQSIEFSPECLIARFTLIILMSAKCTLVLIVENPVQVQFVTVNVTGVHNRNFHN